MKKIISVYLNKFTMMSFYIKYIFMLVKIDSLSIESNIFICFFICCKLNLVFVRASYQTIIFQVLFT